MITRIAFALALCLGAANASADQKEFHAARTETVKATVKSVDPATRMMTLVAKDGSETTFKAADDVRNLDQVKPGDLVAATMDQSLTLWILGDDQPAPELAVGADVTRAKKGEKPGGMMTTDLSGVATVEKIAGDKKSVTLKGPRGKSVKLAVKDPANLEGVKLGTRIGFAYSEALAVAVTPAKAPAKAPATAPAKSDKKK